MCVYVCERTWGWADWNHSSLYNKYKIPNKKIKNAKYCLYEVFNKGWIEWNTFYHLKMMLKCKCVGAGDSMSEWIIDMDGGLFILKMIMKTMIKDY